jgi:hypothetical protein
MADDRITKEEYLNKLAQDRLDLEKRLEALEIRAAKTKKNHGREWWNQATRRKELVQEIQDIETETGNILASTSDTEKSIGSLLTKQLNLQKTLATQKKGSADLSKAVNKDAIQMLKHLKGHTDAGGELTDVQQDQFETLQSILSGTNDLEGINEAIAESKQKEDELTNKDDRTQQKNLTNLLGKEAERLKYTEEQRAQMSLLDQITGGLASKAEGFIDAFQKSPKLAGYLILAAVVTSLVAMGNKFASMIDTVGQKFGSLMVLGADVRENLFQSTIEARKLGGTIDDVAGITNRLSSEFGLSLNEASALSVKVFDTSKALGLSTDEASSLFGMLMQTSNLSAVQAEQLSEGAFQLARQAGVAPAAVMRDIAGSAEVFANFSKDGGNNLADAAVQARQMGISLNTTAKIAEGLLDFENSIAAEMEASVLIGKQLNYQKAREMALNNDIAGAAKNIVEQLGSEADFNALNLIQRNALAKSIGVSTTELAKMVGQSDKLTLSGAMAASSFEDLLGEEGISTITKLMHSFKSLGVELIEGLGPSLTAIAHVLTIVISPITQLLKLFDRLGILGPIITGLAVGLASAYTAMGIAAAFAKAQTFLLTAAQLAAKPGMIASIGMMVTGAIAKVWNGAASMIMGTAGLGTPVAIGLALGTIAAIAASLGAVSGMLPKFHEGGPVSGRATNEQSAVLKADELILTKTQTSAAAGAIMGGTAPFKMDYGEMKKAFSDAFAEGHLTSRISGGDVVLTSERKLGGTSIA